MVSADVHWNDRSVVDTIGEDPARRDGGSDGGLGERDPQVVVLSQVVVVECNETVDGFFH